MPASIRPATAEDAEAVAALWTGGYVTEGEGGRTSPYGKADFFDVAGRGDVFVAERAGAVIGVVALLGPHATPRGSAAGEGEAELSRLVVAASVRRQGVGRELVELCTELARAAGWSAIALWSRSYQREAHRLYESLGYLRTPERDTIDASGHARLVFRLALGENGAVENLAPRLEGSTVALEPLAEEHAEELWEAAQAPEIWTWLADLGGDRGLFERWLELSLETARAGEEGPFATRELASGRIVGSSRFLNVRPADRVVEIGWTWLNPRAWRSGANVEAKLLMMRHAFEELGCVRVEFKTDARNERSRAALAALPAQFEGILRNHMIVPTVGQRDSAYFSVTDAEWPAVRANLERRLASGGKAEGAKLGGEGPSLRYADSVEDLACLEPAWNALQEHHIEITPDLGPRTPQRSLPEAWRIRRSKYERWLRDPETFFVIAELGGEAVGYAFVTVGPPYASWAAGDRLAELETLSVLPGRRGEGVGAALLDAVWKRLVELGVEDMQIVTTVTNVGAQRFYERAGFAPRFAVYYGKAPGPR